MHMNQSLLVSRVICLMLISILLVMISSDGIISKAKRISLLLAIILISQLFVLTSCKQEEIVPNQELTQNIINSEKELKMEHIYDKVKWDYYLIDTTYHLCDALTEQNINYPNSLRNSMKTDGFVLILLSNNEIAAMSTIISTDKAYLFEKAMYQASHQIYPKTQNLPL